MSSEAPWVALAIDFIDSDMFREMPERASHGEVLAWVCLLCWTKAFGRAGKVRVVKSDLAARFHLSMRAVEGMLSRAQKCAAVTIEGEFITVVNWDTYQGKGSSSKYRKRPSFPETSSTKHQSPTTKHQSPSTSHKKPSKAKVAADAAVVKTITPHQRLVQALADAFANGVVGSKGSTFGKVAARIGELNGVPEDVRPRYDALVRSWGGDPAKATIHQLADRWTALGDSVSRDPHAVLLEGKPASDEFLRSIAPFVEDAAA